MGNTVERMAQDATAACDARIMCDGDGGIGQEEANSSNLPTGGAYTMETNDMAIDFLHSGAPWGKDSAMRLPRVLGN